MDDCSVLTVICDGEISTFTVLSPPAFMSDSRSKFTSLTPAVGTVAFYCMVNITFRTLLKFLANTSIICRSTLIVK